MNVYPDDEFFNIWIYDNDDVDDRILGTMIYLWGITSLGHSVCLQVVGFRSYFYAQFKESQDEIVDLCVDPTATWKTRSMAFEVPTESICSIKSVSMQDDRPFKVLKISSPSKKQLDFTASRLKRAHIPIFENKFSTSMRFFTDRELKMSAWLRVHKSHVSVLPSDSEHRARVQINLRCMPQHVFDANEQKVSESSDKLWKTIVPPMRICSFDIEKYSSRKNMMPADIPADYINAIASVFSFYGDPYSSDGKHIRMQASYGIYGYSKPPEMSGGPMTVCCTFGKADDIRQEPHPNKRAKKLASAEEAMICTFFKHLGSDGADIDIISGWNINGYDLHQIWLRGKLYPRIQTYVDGLSRIINMPVKFEQKEFKSAQFGASWMRYYIIPGILNVDGLIAQRKDTSRRPASYGLSYISQLILGSPKYDLPYGILSMLQDSDDASRGRIRYYNLFDSQLSMGILLKELLPRLHRLSTITNLTMQQLLIQGEQKKVMSQLLRQTRKLGLILPTAGDHDEREYDGALVFEGVHEQMYANFGSTLTWMLAHPKDTIRLAPLWNKDMRVVKHVEEEQDQEQEVVKEQIPTLTLPPPTNNNNNNNMWLRRMDAKEVIDPIKVSRQIQKEKAAKLNKTTSLTPAPRQKDHIGPSINDDGEEGSTTPVVNGREWESWDFQEITDPDTGIKFRVYYKSGEQCVIVFDFASLYPSVIMAFNMCYSTKITKAFADMKGWIEGYDYTATPVADNPKIYRYFKARHRYEGVLPKLLRALLAARKAAKNAMAYHEESAEKCRLLGDAIGAAYHKRCADACDADQLGLKVSANSVYGFTAAQALCDKDIAEAICAQGRVLLRILMERATIYLHQYNARCIYGDTDSAMILVQCSIHKALKISQHCANWINEQWFSEVKAEPEKVGSDFLFKVPKIYRTLQWLRRGEPYDKDLIKGFACVRRDGFAYKRIVQRGMLDRVTGFAMFPSISVDYTKDKIALLLSGQVPLEDLMMSFTMRKGTDHYIKTMERMNAVSIARIKGKPMMGSMAKENAIAKIKEREHRQIAIREKIRSRNPDIYFADEDRISYVNIQMGKHAKGTDCAEDVNYAREHKLPLNWNFYLAKFEKPIARVLSPFNDPVDTMKGSHTLVSNARFSLKHTTFNGFLTVQQKCQVCKYNPVIGPGRVVCADPKCRETEHNIISDVQFEHSDASARLAEYLDTCTKCTGTVLLARSCMARECSDFAGRNRVQAKKLDTATVLIAYETSSKNDDGYLPVSVCKSSIADW